VTFLTLDPVKDLVSKALLSAEIRHLHSGGEPDMKAAALLVFYLLGISSSTGACRLRCKSLPELHHLHRPETKVFNPCSQCLYKVLAPARPACLRRDCRPF
jgi:hypothetical protein